MPKSKVKEALLRFVKALQSDGNIMVSGSGPIPVPPGRLNEISKVIPEHHILEAERARLLGMVRLVV